MGVVKCGGCNEVVYEGDNLILKNHDLRHLPDGRLEWWSRDMQTVVHRCGSDENTHHDSFWATASEGIAGLVSPLWPDREEEADMTDDEFDRYMAEAEPTKIVDWVDDDSMERHETLLKMAELVARQPTEDGRRQEPLTEAAIAAAGSLLTALRRESPELYARIGVFPEQDGGVELQLTSRDNLTVVTILRTGDIEGVRARYPRERVTRRFSGLSEVEAVAHLAGDCP